jgi:GNAT superfamily N-acetyltransferase
VHWTQLGGAGGAGGTAAAGATSSTSSTGGTAAAGATGGGIRAAQIRQARPDDLAALADFFGELSLRTRYLRLFTGAAPSRALLRRLTGANGGDVLVATAAGAIIGHAIAVDAPGRAGPTDVGVVVADAWQGLGIGSALVRTLLRRAGERGAVGITMSVLPENHRVLTMVTGHWPAARRTVLTDSVTFRAPLPRRAASRAAGRAAQPAVTW